MILEAYFIIGLIIWGLLLLILRNNNITIRVTPSSTISWLCIVVGWPFVIGWIITNFLDALSDVIEIVRGINGSEGGGDDDDGDS